MTTSVGEGWACASVGGKVTVTSTGGCVAVAASVAGTALAGASVTGVDVAEVSLSYDVSIACFFVSEQQYELEQSPLLMNVRREGVAV